MIMKLRFGSMGYKKLPALAQRWEWIFGIGRYANGQVYSS